MEHSHEGSIENLASSDEGTCDEGTLPDCELTSGVDVKFSSLYIPDNFPNVTFEQVSQIQFKSMEAAMKFYGEYASRIGFSVRKDQVTASTIDGKITRRRLTCNRQGTKKKTVENKNRKRAVQLNTRCNCLAACNIRYNRDGDVYMIDEFIQEHSHRLPHPGFAHLFRSNRNVTATDINCRQVMASCSISTSKCFEYLVTCRGGYEFVGFTLKDFYNSQYRKRESYEDYSKEAIRRTSLISGDGEDTLYQMRHLAGIDPGFFCLFGVDEEGRLGNIFWRDSGMLKDYTSYNDVLLFDATYKTNAYNRPLVLFVGVNHHRQSVLFGCALLIDETAETYSWALKAFKQSMGPELPQPQSVLTDGDEAMYNAVTLEFPHSRHRLCAWHIMKNMNQHIKDPDRRRDFKKCMYWSMSEAMFEHTWAEMVDKMLVSGVSDLVMAWLDTMYNKRQRWGEAYFTTTFCAMCISTQRVEGLNKHLKMGLTGCSRLSLVPDRIAKSLTRMRASVVAADFKAFTGTPELVTHMPTAEKKAGERLTPAIFELVQRNIQKERKYRVVGGLPIGDSFVYTLRQFEKDPDWEWTVERDGEGNFQCSCRLFESDGIPCRHILCVMKTIGTIELPDSLISRRWSMPEMDDYSRSDRLQVGLDSDLHVPRCASLLTIANSICFDASLSGDGYRQVYKAFTKLAIEVEKYRTESNVSNVRSSCGTNPQGTVIRDPIPQRSKRAKRTEPKVGAENSKKSGMHCSYCNSLTHNRKDCKQLAADVAKRTAEVEAESSECQI